MANILQEGFRKLMRYAQNLAEYNKAIQDGIIDENVFVIVLEEKVAKFKGKTFDWSGGGASGDPSDLLTQISVQLDAVESLLDELNDSNIPLIETINEINGEVV